MPATILTSQHYDAVRGLIAPDVTSDHISDAYLSQDPFAPDAEREVRKRLRAESVDVDSLTGEALDVARLAMIHQCVSELCVVAAQILQQDQIEIVTRVQEINWKEKRAFHLSKVTEKVADVVTEVQQEGSTAVSQTQRKLPFGAVGTERREVEVPKYPYRRVDTYND